MPKRSILVWTLAFFALVVAWPMAPAEAHCDGKHTGDHPHCQPGSGGTYAVSVSGDLYTKGDTSPPFTTYEGEDGAGKGEKVRVFFQAIDLDLSFFWSFIVNGEQCFSSAAPLLDSVTALVISEEKDGSAKVRFWFKAFGTDGTTEIKYELGMFGDFTGPDDWRPAVLGEKTTVDLTGWRMRAENKKHKNLSCEDIGEFTAQTVTVERTN